MIDKYSFFFWQFSTKPFFKVNCKQQPIVYPHDWPRSDLYPQVSRKYLAFQISHCVGPAHSCVPAPKYTAPLCFLLASLSLFFKQVKMGRGRGTLNMEQLWHDSPLNNECTDEHSGQLSVSSFGF